MATLSSDTIAHIGHDGNSGFDVLALGHFFDEHGKSTLGGFVNETPTEKEGRFGLYFLEGENSSRIDCKYSGITISTGATLFYLDDERYEVLFVGPANESGMHLLSASDSDKNVDIEPLVVNQFASLNFAGQQMYALPKMTLLDADYLRQLLDTTQKFISGEEVDDLVEMTRLFRRTNPDQAFQNLVHCFVPDWCIAVYDRILTGFDELHDGQQLKYSRKLDVAMSHLNRLELYMRVYLPKQ